MRDYIKKNRQTYNELAEKYLERFNHRSICETNPCTLAKYVFDKYVQMNEKNPIKILELGPGSGAILKEFSKMGCYTTAIEFSVNMAKIACKNSPASTFLIKDIITCSNLLYDQFDIIYVGAFIHLFPVEDEKRVLNKIKKWISKDGMVYLNTTLHEVSEEGFFVKKDYGSNIEHFRRKWEKQDFLNFIVENGFEIIDSYENTEEDREKTWLNLIIRKVKKKNDII